MWSTHFQIGATRTITNIVAKEQNFYAKLNNEILQRYFIHTYIHTYIYTSVNILKTYFRWLPSSCQSMLLMHLGSMGSFNTPVRSRCTILMGSIDNDPGFKVFKASKWIFLDCYNHISKFTTNLVFYSLTYAIL